MTGGTAVVSALLAEGVDTIFGLPGIQNDWFYNALYGLSQVPGHHRRAEALGTHWRFPVQSI